MTESLKGTFQWSDKKGCGKTTFLENLGKNKLFGDVKEAYWISKVELSADRESNIRYCFKDQNVDFKYPNNVDSVRSI